MLFAVSFGLFRAWSGDAVVVIVTRGLLRLGQHEINNNNMTVELLSVSLHHYLLVTFRRQSLTSYVTVVT